MQKVLVAGAGKIGSLIATLLGTCGDYSVTLADNRSESDNLSMKGNTSKSYKYVVMDVSDAKRLDDYLAKHPHEAIISCLPYSCNTSVATIAKKHHLHYFDLTEDTQISATIAKLSAEAKSAFVPQCGVAPGFISIVANDLMKTFESLESVYLRVGALPKYSNNALKYALTWSPDGLINEYGNPCDAVINGKLGKLQPLEDLETIEIDGLHYEAFNTSGGLGTLAASYEGKVNTLNYKTIRYPGHCEKIRFLMNDLQLNESRDVLKNILQKALPQSADDVVLIYVAVKGQQNNALFEKNYMKKCYSSEIQGKAWSAIQTTTASSACAVIDQVLQNPQKYQGLVKQEDFALSTFLQNRFGSAFL